MEKNQKLFSSFCSVSVLKKKAMIVNHIRSTVHLKKGAQVTQLIKENKDITTFLQKQPQMHGDFVDESIHAHKTHVCEVFLTNGIPLAKLETSSEL